MDATCPNCGTINPSDAAFCSECGKALSETSTNQKTGKDTSLETSQEPRFHSTKRSLAKAIPIWVFLFFIDWVTGEKGINWAYWVVVPWFVFGPLASFLMELLDIEEEESLIDH